MSLSPQQLSQRGRIGAHALHSQYDSRELTANARAAFLKRFLDQVEEATPGLPEGERIRRAEHLLRAHMSRLAFESSKARARRKASP
jgi:hypothetical protein